jgi:Domain of unknown function (DUF4399)
MNKLLLSCVAFAVLASAAIAQLPKKKAPEGASVYFLSPKDGETVSSPVTVRFGLKGMGVAPAGIDQPNTGHHHLLVDMATDPDFNAALPVTDNIRHFGAGQTETELKLPPGKHTLQLVLGDSLHIPHDKPIVSQKITITVK